jgi:Flp pilus assembly protein TadD
MPSINPRRLQRWAVVLGCLVGGAAFVFFLASWVAGARHRRVAEAVALARKHLDEGRPGLAFMAVQRIPADFPEAAEVLAVRGTALAALGEVEASRKNLEQSLALRPDQPMVMKVLAAIYFSGSEMGRGLEMLRSAARLDPGDFRPWFAMGGVYSRSGDAAAAVTSYREALQRRPGDSETRVGLVAALLATSESDESASLLESLRKDQPDDPVILGLGARLAALRGDDPEAVRLADRALGLDPDQREILLLRSKLGSQSGRLDRALHDAERAVELDPIDPAGLWALVRAESMMGLKQRAAATAERHKQARDHRQRINLLVEQVQARPKDPEPRWRLGRAAAEAGSKTLAVQSFRAALSLDPRCEPALRGLAALESAPPGVVQSSGVP